MKLIRDLHPDFEHFLGFKEQALIDLYCGLRNTVLELYPEANELLYHTHALTSVFTISEKLGDGFCMIPIYTSHLNLGFHKGTLLDDPKGLLQGTGKLIRHIPIIMKADYQSKDVKALIQVAIQFALDDMDKPTKSVGQTISKIKRP